MYLANDKSLTKLRSSFKKLKIGLCHGVFDIIHQGHLDHFREAKNKVKEFSKNFDTTKADHIAAAFILQSYLNDPKLAESC